MTHAPEISMVVPAYRAELMIGRAIGSLVTSLQATGRSFELLIVDDGSDDSTVSVAQEALSEANVQGEVLHGEINRGKGHALRRGVLAARGELILFTDHDVPYNLDCIPLALGALDDGHDLVIADRHLPGSSASQPRSRLRRAASSVFTLVVSQVLVPGFRDTQAGFKGFQRDAARRLFLATWLDGFAVDVELLRLARLAGLKIARIPVELVNDDVSTVRLLPHATHMLAELGQMLWTARPPLTLPPQELPDCIGCGGPGWDRMLINNRRGELAGKCRRCQVVSRLDLQRP